jgi:uncharacterized protein YndB with AHSA1/START domain
MGPISMSATVDAPRERVFDFICDLSTRPAWTDHFVHSFQLERIEPAGQGAAARFQVKAPGVRYMDTTIAEAERPHRIVERGHGGRSNRVDFTTVWELSEGPGAVTTVTLTLLAQPLRRGKRGWRRHWRKALRRLGGAIESGVPPEQTARVAGGNRQLTGIA